MPTGDHGLEYLNQMLSNYEGMIPVCTTLVNNLPGERQAAIQKLADRRDTAEQSRIAEGRLGPQWEGKWPLGNGSFGTASLFVKQDSLGNVSDVSQASIT